MQDMSMRNVTARDYHHVILVLNEWWSGRAIADMLPKLFFEHFCDTGFVLERDGEILGFLVGFMSQSEPGEAYIHFVGVSPKCRKSGAGQRLYQAFFEVVRERGAHVVRCLTSPVNTVSIAYHQRMGFTIEPGDKRIDGIDVHTDYDGPGQDRVLFVRSIER